MRSHPDATADWNIAWDDRGHFSEPHTGHEIGLGTLAVRGYIKRLRDLPIRNAGISATDVDTMGPDGRYGAVLFLEKEGFTQILEAAKIAERYDLAIMSTKGMSVTAARTLVEELVRQARAAAVRAARFRRRRLLDQEDADHSGAVINSGTRSTSSTSD